MAQQSQQLKNLIPNEDWNLRTLNIWHSNLFMFLASQIRMLSSILAFFLSPYILRIPFNVVRQGPVVWIIQYTLKKKKRKEYCKYVV